MRFGGATKSQMTGLDMMLWKILHFSAGSGHALAFTPLSCNLLQHERCKACLKVRLGCVARVPKDQVVPDLPCHWCPFACLTRVASLFETVRQLFVWFLDHISLFALPEFKLPFFMVALAVGAVCSCMLSGRSQAVPQHLPVPNRTHTCCDDEQKFPSSDDTACP